MGLMIHLGNFDECLQGSGGVPALGMSLQLAYCIPSTCSPQDFQTVFNEYLSSNPLLGGMGISVAVPDGSCQTSDEKELSTGDWLAVALLLIIALLAVTSTAYDLFKTGSKNKLFTSFSWYSNGKKLLSTNSSSDTLEAIHGIRFLSICWWVPSFWRLYITNATVSVDTFFFLGGLLVCYLFLKQMDKEKAKFNIALYYFHRYIRLTPPYAMVILLTTTLLRYVSSGPLIKSFTEGSAKPCYENWWTNLLYVNNYIEADNMCLGHTWYLAIDMQLFILSPIILYPLLKWPRKFSLSLLGALIVGGLITAFVVCFEEEFTASFLSTNLDQMYYQYFPTHTRFVPWLIGVGFGYLFHETKKRNLKLSKIMVLLGWCIGLTALLGSFFGAHPFNSLDKLEISGSESEEPKDFLTNFEASIYVALFRSGWALGVGWITYACVFGYGGPVNTFLSWKFFQPLSRVSYGIYLIHGICQNVRIFSTRTTNYLTDLNLIPEFFSDVILSVFVAAILSLCVESPVIALEQYLLRGGKSRNKKEKLQEQTVSLPKSKGIDVDFNSELQDVKTEIPNDITETYNR
ncbi:hypothetical protein C0J52_07349 [Blattella germanica]|nr:hypothetical protein C0J52_07349 [Blattella germanica]